MVIELKGQDVDLDKPQNRANDKRTPIEQVFGYAQKSSEKSGLVDWILVSNYKEFRLSWIVLFLFVLLSIENFYLILHVKQY